MILIGSRALEMVLPGFLERKPRDFDFVSDFYEAQDFLEDNNITSQEVVNNKLICKQEPPLEFELIGHTESWYSSTMLVNLVETDSKTRKSKAFGLVPSLDVLFTLKMSHRYLKNSPHFWKTALDYHRLKSIGCQVPPAYKEFLLQRERDTYAYSHPKLNMGKKDFFDPNIGVRYTYDHDSIHKSVARHGVPAYTLYMKEGEEVQTDKNKFFSLGREIQLAGVAEEAEVLAIERSLVPHPGKMTPKQAFVFALSKVCSSITSGWFREFGYEHIFEVLEIYNPNYWDKFQEDVKVGRVPYYEGAA